MTTMVEPLIQQRGLDANSSDFQSTDSRLATSSSASSFSTASSRNPYDLENQEELNKETSWNPLKIVSTLSGFNPEEGLEYAWTPDDSAAGDSHRSFATGSRSIHSSPSSASTTDSEQTNDEVSISKRELGPTKECSPVKLKLDLAKNEETKSDSGHYGSNTVERLQGDDMREYDMITERSGIEMRESNESVSQNSQGDGGGVDGEIRSKEADTTDLHSFEDHAPTTGRNEQEPLESDATLSVPINDIQEDPVEECAGSVEISLIEKPKSASILKRMKRAVRSLFGKKQAKSRNSKEDLQNSEAKRLVEREGEAPLPPPSTNLRCGPTCSSDDANDEFLAKQQTNYERQYSVGVLTAVSTVTTSNVTRKVTDKEVEYPNLTQTDTADVDRIDTCLTVVGLGCLVPY